MSADGDRSVLHVPLVVHGGRGGWNAPLRLAEDAEWLSPTLAGILAGVDDAAELARAGALIIDCATGEDFLPQFRRH